MDAKIVVMGNTGVGKTSLLHRYTQGKFEPKNTTSTTGAFFVTKKVYVDGLKVRLQLWDTAGQERFRSMAPMYYRGANAALLLYDITNMSTFNDIRGWLEELRKNCPPELIIFIVGSKADLHRHRQVTSDLARLSLHTWFPPPRPPTPPAPQQVSTLSYIRPRFTSFTSIRSVPALSSNKSSSLDRVPHLDSSPNLGVALRRTNTGPGLSQIRATGISRPTTSPGIRSLSPQSRFSLHFGAQTGGWNEIAETSGSSYNDDDDTLDVEDQEWGLNKGMELFEVSAKDDSGIDNLFESLISTIITKKDTIEQENELKKRDSVYLSSVSTPTWANQADEEDLPFKTRSTGGWSCCTS
jgi:small GTP-binding protein